MKRTLSLLAALLVLASFSACRPFPKAPSLPKEESGDLVIHVMPLPNLSPYPYTDEWMTYMKDAFGVNVEFNMLSRLHSEAFYLADYLQEQLAMGAITGLVKVNAGLLPLVMRLYEAGLIVPVNDYLADNPRYALIPEGINAFITHPDGQVLGIPTGSSPSIVSRVYKKEWLENLGHPVPVNLHQLYETVKDFTYGDPNRSGKPDTVGFMAYRNWGIHTFKDIFYANGCFVNDYSGSIAYDWSLGSYEDAMLKPNAVETIAYLKRLLDEKIMVNSTLDPNTVWNRNHEHIGSMLANIDLLADFEVWSHSFHTAGLSDRYLNKVNYYNGYMILTANTENKRGMLNSFVDVFYGDTDKYMAGYYGIKGVDYELSETTLRGLRGPRLGLMETDSTLHPMVASSTRFAEQYQTLQNGIASGLFFTNVLDVRQEELGRTIYLLGNAFYTNFFNNEDLNPEEFIQGYLDAVKSSGGQQILDELNDRAGTIATYRY